MNEPTAALHTGVWPVAPTVFRADGRLDLDGQRRVTRFLLDSGVDGICILANYSEQFSLDDHERQLVQEATFEEVGDRVGVIVTVSHPSSRVTAARVRAASAAGACMVMIMPPFVGTTLAFGPDLVRTWFEEVGAVTDIPIMLQDAPMSPTRLSAKNIADLADAVLSLRYAKVETARAAETIRALRSSSPDTLPGVFDGEEGVTLIPDLDAGAVGAMTSATAPEVMKTIVDAHAGGDRATAVETWERLLPLVHYENRQCGLSACKVLLHEGGVIASDHTRLPVAPLSPETRDGLLELARARDLFALRWDG